ncbi:MAG: hypothetical protein KC421_06485 [Anaerolineales bacterium]|nr:hypothetical protein [Anaerolineales bacterium]
MAEPVDYSTLTFDDAVELIPDTSADWFTANSKFAAGDHWQDGDGWVGPQLGSDHPLKNTADTYIQRIFTVEDMIRDLMDRHVSGVLGKAMSWTMVDRTAQGGETGE